MISVVIVNYNAGRHLYDCVRSVLTTVDKPRVVADIIIVDNASSDRSIEAVETMPSSDITVLRNPRNVGLSRAVNDALAHCTGEYVLLLNPDCLLTTTTLTGLLTVFQRFPDTGICGCLMFNLDGSEQRGDRRREPTPLRALARSLGLGGRSFDQHTLPLPAKPVVVDAVSGSCLLIKKPLMDRLGGMDSGFFLHFEDLDLCKRTRDHGAKVRFTPSVCAFHVQGVSSESMPLWLEWQKHRSMFRYFVKHHRPTMTPDWVGAWLAHVLFAPIVLIRYGLVCLSWIGGDLKRRLRARSPATNHRFAYRGRQAKRLLEMEHGLTQVAGDDANAAESTPRGTAPGVIVMGARSIVGRYVVAQLAESHYQPWLFSSAPNSLDECVESSQTGPWRWHREFALKAPAALFANVDAAIHLAPIWTLSNYTQRYAALGVTKIVALSSSSIDGKRDSQSPSDQRLVSRLMAGEQAAREACGKLNIELIVFRPTLIYDAQRDGNIARIRWWIETFGILPVLGRASGLRQPVFAGDVAKACVAALARQPGSGGDAYSLAGAETLSYDEMVSVVFKALRKPVRILRLPRWALRAAIGLARRLPWFRDLSTDMADRMLRDLCVDDAKAREDFDWLPASFTPTVTSLIANSNVKSTTHS